MELRKPIRSQSEQAACRTSMNSVGQNHPDPKMRLLLKLFPRSHCSKPAPTQAWMNEFQEFNQTDLRLGLVLRLAAPPRRVFAGSPPSLD